MSCLGSSVRVSMLRGFEMRPVWGANSSLQRKLAEFHQRGPRDRRQHEELLDVKRESDCGCEAQRGSDSSVFAMHVIQLCDREHAGRHYALRHILRPDTRSSNSISFAAHGGGWMPTLSSLATVLLAAFFVAFFAAFFRVGFFVAIYFLVSFV